MYARSEAKETREDVLHAAIRDIRFGTLVVADDEGAPQAVHLPLLLKTPASGAVLEAHVARANPIWKLFERERPALVMFQGPQAYVRPGWYPAKREHGKVVPTWAYVSVHARGVPTIMPMDTLLQHVREISDALESGQREPWSVDDAPEGFVSALARGIVGLRIPVASLDGVWKLNQHRSEADQAGMVTGFGERQDQDSHALAALMRERQAAQQQQ
jgi:transcriptional regulator